MVDFWILIACWALGHGALSIYAWLAGKTLPFDPPFFFVGLGLFGGLASVLAYLGRYRPSALSSFSGRDSIVLSGQCRITERPWEMHFHNVKDYRLTSGLAGDRVPELISFPVKSIPDEVFEELGLKGEDVTGDSSHSGHYRLYIVRGPARRQCYFLALSVTTQGCSLEARYESVGKGKPKRSHLRLVPSPGLGD